jgi:hypothetical protein
LSLRFRRVRVSLEERLLIPSRMSTCPSVRPSVHLSAFIKSVVTGCTFVNFDIGNVYENLSRKLTFAENRTNISGTFQTWVHCVGKIRTKYSVARQNCKGKALFAFHCKTKVFHFIQSQMWLNSKKGTYCCFPMPKLVMWRCYSVVIRTMPLFYFWFQNNEKYVGLLVVNMHVKFPMSCSSYSLVIANKQKAKSTLVRPPNYYFTDSP